MDLVASLEEEADFLRLRREQAASARETVRPDRFVLEGERRVHQNEVVGCGRRIRTLCGRRGQRDERPSRRGEAQGESRDAGLAEKSRRFWNTGASLTES